MNPRLCLLIFLCSAFIAAAQTVTLSSTDTAASESSNNASVTFTRSGPTTNALALNLIFSGAAVNGVDVVAVPATVSIPAGQSVLTITVTTINDTLIEGAETFAVSLAPSANYTAIGNVGIVINDNDNATPIADIGIIFAPRVIGANFRDTKLNVYRPSTGSGPWPVVIYFAGGAWTSQDENTIPTLLTNLTAHGYAVVSADYASSGFARWPAQIQDAKAAVRWVRANAAAYGFDATKIGVTGGSSGGHITAWLGVSGGAKTARCGSQSVDLVGTVGGNLEQSDTVQAAAPFFPPTDFLTMDHYLTPGVPDHNLANSPESNLIGGIAIQTVPEKAATANPITLVRAGLPPFWITHGSTDMTVSFNQSELLNAALHRAEQPTTFWPVPGGGHGPNVLDSQEVIGLMKTFFDRHLKGIATNQLPIPRVTASILSGPAPLTVNFDATTSTDADGVITKFTWASGDNTGTAGPTASFTFAKPGLYPVCLAIRDDQGGTASLTTDIQVTPVSTTSPTPPSITITGPTADFLYARTGDFILQTSTATTSGSVEFFINGQLIAWDNQPPYNTTIGSLPPGTYTATARLTESTGAAATSVPVAFQVIAETSVLAQPALAANQLSFRYHRFTDGTLTYHFERSENLTSWQTFTASQTLLTDGPQVQLLQATDPLTTSGVPRRFLRVRTTKP